MPTTAYMNTVGAFQFLDFEMEAYSKVQRDVLDVIIKDHFQFPRTIT